MTGGYYSSGKPGSGKEKRTLQSVKTHFYVGTEVSIPRQMSGMLLTSASSTNLSLIKQA